MEESEGEAETLLSVANWEATGASALELFLGVEGRYPARRSRRAGLPDEVLSHANFGGVAGFRPKIAPSQGI